MTEKTSESYLKGVIEPKVDTIATDTTTDIPATITTLQGDITDIKTVTDVIPDAGAMTSIAKEATLGSPIDTDIATDIANVGMTASSIRESTGFWIKNAKKCTGNGDTKISLFTVIGAVRIHEIVGTITTVTNATTFQKVGIILYEATPTTVELTDITTGVDCSSTVAGSLLIRTGVTGATMALEHLKADICRVTETKFDGGNYGLVVLPRAGVATNIQVEFTGDANTDVDILWGIRYTPLTTTSEIQPVI